MKQKILTYFILVTACIGLHSCLFQQDDYFDKSSAERAAADVIKCSELLKSSPNGWLLEYYIGSGYAMGGITLLCKFDDKKVTMASTLSTPNVPSGVFIESLYQVVSEQSTMLTFDSYNELIHAFAAPAGSGNDANANMGGDYEFIIMDASDNQITLLGKKYGNTMTMTRMPVTTKWKEYIRGVNEIEENAYLYQFDIMAGGEKIGYLKRDNYTLSFSGKTEPSSTTIPFVFTPNGLHFREPVIINGKKMQYFAWDNAFMTFTCTDESAQGVKLVSLYPEGYLYYHDLLGSYKFKCKALTQPESGKEQTFESKEFDITISQNVENKSFNLSGLNVPISITYDRSSGKMIIPVQALGSINGYYGALSFGNGMSYIPYFMSTETGYYFSVVSKTESTSPLTISFKDEGTFSQLTGAEPTALVFQGYTSPAYSQSTLGGWVGWYDDYTIEKQ